MSESQIGFLAVLFGAVGLYAGYLLGRNVERKTWIDHLERLEKASRHGEPFMYLED